MFILNLSLYYIINITLSGRLFLFRPLPKNVLLAIGNAYCKSGCSSERNESVYCTLLIYIIVHFCFRITVGIPNNLCIVLYSPRQGFKMNDVFGIGPVFLDSAAWSRIRNSDMLILWDLTPEAGY